MDNITMSTYHNDADVWTDSALSENMFNKRKGNVLLQEENVEISEEDRETKLQQKTRREHKSKVNVITVKQLIYRTEIN
jgi:hypothetical protein